MITQVNIDNIFSFNVLYILLLTEIAEELCHIKDDKFQDKISESDIDEAIRLRLVKQVHNRDLSRKRHNRYLSIKKGRSIILLQTRNTKTYTFCSHVSTRLNPLWTDKFLFYIYVKLSPILETHTGHNRKLKPLLDWFDML